MTIENSEYKLDGKVLEVDTGAYNVAILFDYIKEETSTVEADITDNWVESNYSLQDHIAIKPRIYRLRGCVGEVVYENSYSTMDWLDNQRRNHPVLDKTLSGLDGIAGVFPIVSNYTNAAMNIAKQIESSVDRYKKIWKNFTKQNQFNNKRQKWVYSILMQMLQNRIPVKLIDLMYDFNPFSQGYYDRSYYLQSVSAHQGETSYISDIEVTIKEFRIATTKTTKLDKSKFAGMTASQKTSEANNGDAKGSTTNSQNALSIVSNKNKEVAKAALQNKPMAYNAVKTFYNGIQKSLQGVSIVNPISGK